MPGFYTSTDHKYNCPSSLIDLLVYLGWSAALVFQFCVLNASIKCQIWKERQDKNILLGRLQMLFQSVCISPKLWKHLKRLFCHFLFPIHSRIVLKTKAFSLYQTLDNQRYALCCKSTAITCIKRRCSGKRSSVKDRTRVEKERKSYLETQKEIVQCQHPSIWLINFFQFGQEVH